MDFPASSAGKESTCNAGDPSLIPGWGKSAGGGTGYPLQYSWPGQYLIQVTSSREGFFVLAKCSKWDLSSLTRDLTKVPCVGSAES